MGAGTVVRAQSAPLQYQKQISMFTSFASELEWKFGVKIELFGIL